MKDEYLIWKRLEESVKNAISEAESTQLVNRKVLLMASQEILKLERAGKVPKNIGKSKTGIG